MAPIDDIANALAKAIIDALKDRQDELTAIAEAGGSKASGGIFSDVGKLTDILGEVLGLAALLNPELGLLEAVESAAGGSGRGFGLGYLFGYAGYQAAEPFMRTLIQLANKLAVDMGIEQQLDIGQVAQMIGRNILTPNEGYAEAQRQGYDHGRVDHLVTLQYDHPDVGTLMTLLNLKIVNEGQVKDALTLHGYAPDWIDALFATRRQLLSVADLALANLRGEIDDTTMYGYADQLGVTHADMDVLVQNTGEPPGPEQLMEALRRGFIDDQRFQRGIRQSRVRNEWIDVEQKLAFGPMSTADAVRAVVEGYLTDDEGKAIAMQNGLLPDHWTPLREAFGRPLSHDQMIELMRRGKATKEQVVQAIRESDLKNKYIDQAIDLGRRLVPERTIVSMLNHGVLDHPTALKMLKELGFDDTDSLALIKLGTAEHTTAHKTLSKSDVLTMYADTLLTRQAALDRLTKLGYTQPDSVAMLDLADYKRKAQALKLIERGIEASLKAHHITEDAAIKALVGAGVDATQARVLVDEWLQARRIVTRTLSESQVIKAVEDKIISPDEGRVRLMASGFGDPDITILYKIHGIIPIG